MKRIIFILSIIFLICRCSYSDAFLVSIAITEGEKSKDSWSSNTSISISGNTLSYVKSFNGSIKRNNDSIEKICNLTNKQVAEIQSIIKNNNLLASDSIEDTDSKYKSYEHFINIAADIVLEEKVSRIRINGDISGMRDKDLYINCNKLIYLIQDYVEKCK